MSIFIIPLLFFISVKHGAPYARSKQENIEKMIALASVKQGERMADLGSGDGRIVLAFAQVLAEAHGYEIQPLLVIRARRHIRKNGFTHKAFIHWSSFWKEDFSSFNVITVFGIPYIMHELEKKLLRELRPGARVISNGYAFPHWQEIKKAGKVYLYEKK